MLTINMNSRDCADWDKQREVSRDARRIADLDGNSGRELVYVYKECQFPKTFG
jgi:hypothetical protein